MVMLPIKCDLCPNESKWLLDEKYYLCHSCAEDLQDDRNKIFIVGFTPPPERVSSYMQKSEVMHNSFMERTTK